MEEDQSDGDKSGKSNILEKAQEGISSVVKGIETVGEKIWKGADKTTTKSAGHQDLVEYRDLDYSIRGGDVFGELQIKLGPGDTVFGEAGSLIWMDEAVQVDSSMKGGVFSGIKRVFSGETLFQNAYYVDQGKGRVALAPPFPSSIVPIKVKKDEDWILNRNSFLAATGNINVAASWQGLRSIFGRGKSILTRAESYGDGIMWISIFGMTERHELKPGQKLIVDGINVAAFSAAIDYTVATKGIKFFIFGGAGFVFTFTGPGIVYTQSRSIEEFNAVLQNSFISNLSKNISKGTS